MNMDILVILASILSVFGMVVPTAVFGFVITWAMLGIPVTAIVLIVRSCRA